MSVSIIVWNSFLTTPFDKVYFNIVFSDKNYCGDAFGKLTKDNRLEEIILFLDINVFKIEQLRIEKLIQRIRQSDY